MLSRLAVEGDDHGARWVASPQLGAQARHRGRPHLSEVGVVDDAAEVLIVGADVVGAQCCPAGALNPLASTRTIVPLGFFATDNIARAAINNSTVGFIQLG